MHREPRRRDSKESKGKEGSPRLARGGVESRNRRRGFDSVVSGVDVGSPRPAFALHHSWISSSSSSSGASSTRYSCTSNSALSFPGTVALESSKPGFTVHLTEDTEDDDDDDQSETDDD